MGSRLTMRGSLVVKTVRNFARTAPQPPRKTFDTHMSAMIAQANKICAEIDPEKLKFFEMAANAIESLTPDEKKYFVFRTLREDPRVSLSELQNGMGFSNAFEKNQNMFAGAGMAKRSQKEAQEAPKVAVEAPKVEEVKVKMTADLEYQGCDPAKKMGAIKEVKALMNIGLKEAKELVEGGITTLKKAIKREEAEELAAKLTSAGCIVKVI